MPPPIRWLAVPLTLLLLAAGAPGEEEPDERPRVTLTRDLSAFPASEYELVEAHSNARERTIERMGEADRKVPSRREVELLFGVRFRPPVAAGGAAGQMACTVRRISIQLMTEKGEEHLYDSDGEPSEGDIALANQFKHILGRTSTAVVTRAKVGPFCGLDAGWTKFGEESGWSERSVNRNKASFGDARLLRMLGRGRHYLRIPAIVDPGTEAEPEAEPEPALERSVTLAVGDTWTVERPHRGSDGRPIVLEHVCTLESAADGYGVIRVEWHVNELRPTADDSGTVTCTGMDERGTEVLTVHLASGVVTEWTRKLASTRQKAVLPTQVTVRVTETDSFRLRPKESARDEK